MKKSRSEGHISQSQAGALDLVGQQSSTFTSRAELIARSNEENLSDMQGAALMFISQNEQRFRSRAQRIANEGVDDVMQEFRLQVISDAEFLRKARDLGPFLFGTLTKIACQWRKNNVDRRVDSCESPDLHPGAHYEALSLSSGVDEDFGLVDLGFRNLFIKQIARERLTAGTTHTDIFMRVFDGESLESIAQKYDISIAAVRSHYQHAVRRLRGQKLGQEFARRIS